MSVSSDSLRRWEPYAGVAYVVFFLASMAVSNPPADNASNQKWIQSYASHHEQIHHLATGLLLLLAGLSLMTFLVALWRRVAAAHPAEPSRLPVAAAGAAAALIGAGGMVMAYISGGELLGHYPLPSVDLLRMSNDLGFALAGVAGSWAAGAAVATLSIQGYTAGIFGDTDARLRSPHRLRPAPGDAVRPDRRTIPLGTHRSRDVDPAPRAGRAGRDGCRSGRRQRRLESTGSPVA